MKVNNEDFICPEKYPKYKGERFCINGCPTEKVIQCFNKSYSTNKKDIFKKEPVTFSLISSLISLLIGILGFWVALESSPSIKASLSNHFELVFKISLIAYSILSTILIFKLIFENRFFKLVLLKYMSAQKCIQNDRLCSVMRDYDSEKVSTLLNFNNHLNKNGFERFCSRREFLNRAQHTRETEEKSYHVLYLNKSSIEIYNREEWLTAEDENSKDRRQRLVLIDSRDYSDSIFKSDVEKIVKQINKTSHIKILKTDELNDKKNYKEMIKDFGIFHLKSNAIQGFFTMTNFSSKYAFSMSTGDFIIIHERDILSHYRKLFIDLWNEDDIRLMDYNDYLKTLN